MVRLPEHNVVRTLADNARVRERLQTLHSTPVEFFRVDNGEGILLDCWMLKPSNFDPKKQYPLLFFVYGEPWGQTVADSWTGSRYLWHLMLSQQGYIVASVDNRGTAAPRGREWRKVVYRKIGVHASADQAAAARAIADRPYVDPSRIGIWGWSGGGSMSLNMIFRYPEIYGTAMAVAPVPDLRYYDTIYQERYMGLPDQNAEDYRLGSPITFAHQLRGNLLIVHGTGDDNVHYQGTEALINALVAAGRQFTMMAYPNRSHGIYEGDGTTMHLYTLLTDYLMDNMPAGWN
jgi:dipeptidyl-peptidase-4